MNLHWNDNFLSGKREGSGRDTEGVGRQAGIFKFSLGLGEIEGRDRIAEI